MSSSLRDPVDLSIVIATYNREELLPRTLPALAGQESGGARYEVLFMDDGSTDGSGDVISRAAAEDPERFRYFRLPHSGTPGGPRNRGVAEARGHVVLLLDDDVVPERDLVRRHVAFHARRPEPEAAALGELYLPPEVERDPMSLFHAFPYDEVRRRRRLGFLFFWTCNVSLKRAFMLAHGMFDEEAALHPLEDMECGYRLAQAGMRLEFLPEARGQHVHKMRPEWVARKGLRTGRAQAALLEKVSDPAVHERFHLLAPGARGPHRVVQRLRRWAGSAVDNPFTVQAIRWLGGEGPRRNWATDAYHYLIFRRNIIAGFEEARRERGSRAQAPAAAGFHPEPPQ